MSDFDYDISHYTDEELINEILGLDSNVSDRVLESKILQEMRNYEYGDDIDTQNMYKFLEDIYDYFYAADLNDKPRIINGQDRNDPNYRFKGLDDSYNRAEIQNPDGTLLTQTIDTASEDYRIMQQQRAAIASNRIQDVAGPSNRPQYNTNQTIDRTPNSVSIMDFSANLSRTSTQDSYNIEYPKGKTNPIRRQTMFKMLSIDSQFRDDYYNTGATNFTMNLSTPITDVISMKLYSVQIPYTWYTINNNFGSNFIFLKGNSPGINNGDHDIQIKIPSGNYDAASLMTALNARIATLASGYSTSDADPYDYRDLSFGQTRFVYDSATVKTRFEIDLKQIYNESDYQMSFPYYTNPQDLENSVKSIPGYLGFNNTTYDVYKVYSQLKAYVSSFTSQTTFNVDASNSYFDIIKYQGANSYNANSTIIETIRIQLSQINTSTSKTNLINNFNTALQTSPYIDPTYSSFSQVDITDPSNQTYYGWSHFEIKVKLNRKTTQNVENSKLIVKFPTETQVGAHIWTGNDSCFKFIKEINELCELSTETPTVLSNYVIRDDVKIVIDCIKPYYDVNENTRIATLVPSPAEGYLQYNYIDAIQNSLTLMNNATKIPEYKPNGEFNNTSTYFNILNSRAHFQFDINRVFDQTSYVIDLSGSILSKFPFEFDSKIDDLSLSSYTITRSFPGLASYSINNTNNRIRIYPKSSGNGYSNFGNQNVPFFDITIPNGIYKTIQSLMDAFNESFGDTPDYDGETIMRSCFFSVITEPTTINTFNITLSFKIEKVLTEKDYRVSFVDDINGSWSENLFMTDSSYNLANYIDGLHANIYGSEIFYINTIKITDENNKIKFTPYANGVADDTGANDIFITIPASTTEYTRQSLIDELNRQVMLVKDPQDENITILQGTTFELITNEDKQYTKLRLNINKTFRARDYKLVIYDAYSFVYCNVGVTNSQNIRNSTFDSTLGWLLGFHSFTEYNLVDFTKSGRENDIYSRNIFSNTEFSYSYNSTNKKIVVIGDSILNTNLYNYFLIVLDDFVQSHVSDGLITVASAEKDVALPSYAMRAQYNCDPISGRKVAVSGTSKLNTNLNSKQLYAMNQLYQTRQVRNRSYSAGPSLKDVFAIVPLKLSGAPGGNYVEFGGTLQNQDRKYFGPVRIQKLSIKLMNDKGDVVDLNGADWSITIVCEIMTGEGVA